MTYIVLDLLIKNSKNQYLISKGANSESFNSPQNKFISLYLADHKHPVEQIKNYFQKNKIEYKSIKLLPSLACNKFNTEMDDTYLVLFFFIEIDTYDITKFQPDDMNATVRWISFEEFIKDPDTLPELKKNNLESLINGDSVDYKGVYNEEDGSNDVIEINKV